MTVRRSNPWPAFADLFAALLIATFAGFFVVTRVFEIESQKRAEAQKGAEKSVELSERVEELESEIAQRAAELENVNRQLANQKNRITYLQTELRKYQEGLGGGLDRPPCLIAEGGQIVPLVAVAVGDDGLTMQRIASQQFDEELQHVVGLERLRAEEVLTVETFRSLAGAIDGYARNPTNVFGSECAFYARLEVSTQSKERFATLLAHIGDFFYISNPTEVSRFLKQ